MAGQTTYLVILGAITGRLAGISSVKNVQAYQRHVGDWKAMLAIFLTGTTTQTVHGWTVSRSGVAEEWLTNNEVIRTHTFVIRGVYGVQDALNSEGAFQSVVEAISDSFRADFNFGGAAEFHEPVQWTAIDYRVFGGILCHYAEGSIAVRERLQGGS